MNLGLSTKMPIADFVRSLSKRTASHPFLVSFLFVAFFFSLESYLLTPFFLVNDDHIQLFAALGVGPNPWPEDHLVIMNLLIGKVLRFLYLHFPDIRWYPVLLVGVRFLAYWAFLSACLLQSKRGFALALMVPYLIFVDFNYFMSLNYTISSSLAFQGGAILSTILLTAGDRSTQVKTTLLSFSCLFISFLVRMNSFLVTGVFMAPFSFTVCGGPKIEDFFSCSFQHSESLFLRPAPGTVPNIKKILHGGNICIFTTRRQRPTITPF